VKTLVLFTAMLKRGFIEMRRYAFDTLSGLITLVLFFLLIFYGARALLGGGTASGGTLEQIVVGYFVWILAIFTFSDSGMELNQEAQVGTLEQQSMSPMGLPRVIVTNFAAAFLFQLVILFGMLVLMMAISGRWLTLNLGTLLPLLLLTVIGIQGIGLMAGGLAVVFKRMQSALQILQFVFVLWIAAPLDRFGWVKYLPLRWGTELIQRSMIEGTSLFSMPAGDVVFLVLNSVAWFVVGLAVFKYFERVARDRALLGHY
jgi:ABC-2 type transport system permease protein